MTEEHPPNAYLPIGYFPEYQNFKYHFDYITILALSTFICFIPSCFATIKMTVFYWKNISKNFSKEIHPNLFKSFIFMQIFNIIYTILDFLLVRIPCTTIVTSYFSTMKPNSIVRYFVSGFYCSEYLSQSFTVLFCFVRVLVLYKPRQHMEISNKIITIWAFVSVILSSGCAFPHVLNDAMGMQLDVPFQYGAFFLTTTFVYGNGAQIIGNLIFSVIVTVCIIITTGMMVWKLKKLKMINSSRRSKAEMTLTITMFIILIPSILVQTLAVSSLVESKVAGYIILIRPILLDCRVYIVSCYFYWTHPYFKHTSVSHSVVVRSVSNIDK